MEIHPKVMAMKMFDLIKLRDSLEYKSWNNPKKYKRMYDMVQRAIEAKVI